MVLLNAARIYLGSIQYVHIRNYAIEFLVLEIYIYNIIKSRSWKERTIRQRVAWHVLIRAVRIVYLKGESRISGVTVFK